MWLSLSLSLYLSVMWTGKFVSVFVMLSTNDQQKLIDTIASLSSLFSLFSLAPCSWNLEDEKPLSLFPSKGDDDDDDDAGHYDDGRDGTD